MEFKKNHIIVPGKIIFDPDDVTKKHEEQAVWKKIAMVFVPGDVCEYYAWFLNKRFNLQLNKPLRGAHISFINDSRKDFRKLINRTDAQIDADWERVKEKYNKRKVDITLDISPRTDDKHWWLNIPEEERYPLQNIRNELCLSRPFFGMHLSIGYCNEKNIDHSKYIHHLIKKGYI